jgi:L-fucose isomerase-like protein
LYADPSASGLADHLRALARPYDVPKSAVAQANLAEGARGHAERAADRVLGALADSQITVVGKHPDGFDTCEFDPDLLTRLANIKVNHVSLNDLFDRARATDAERVAAVKNRTEAQVAGLGEVDADQLDRSFRVFCALEDVQRDTGASGLAVRCWPEMFTEYGCAACGPMAMMNQKKVPSACEADVNGSVTQLILQELAGEPAWMADLVDITPADNSAVLWHCGLAPISMCDPEFKPEATIHTNRRMPLLHQFPIKPGRITLARLSRSRNSLKLVLAGAEVIRAPMAFTGCSGTVRFDKPASEVSTRILDEALEHHFALAYGDHRDALRAMAIRWGIPVLELA